MKQRLLAGGICLALVAILGEIVCPATRAQSGSAATLTARAGTIAGTALNGNDSPVAAARLRLRNLTSGRILMTTRADQQGRFQFAGVLADAYVVELVDDAGPVLGLTRTVTVAPAETVTAIVRLAGRLPWYSGFFTNTATAAVSSAAGLGISAVGTGSQPASGRF